ncbi:MAG: hypothetical protein BWK80_52690 [Desulfobacteraceae bacterium IS3]|nr:MAG: hypothetical protein BWK80_52690 [Desulfobacteraceae bacterium IS3]
MSVAMNLTLSEFRTLLSNVRLPSDTRLTVSFEDEESGIEIFRRKKAVDAIRKLKGSGNGNLLDVLLKEREKDRLQ